MMHELIDTRSDPGLAEIAEVWSTLTEHVRQAIVTLVTSVTVTDKEGDEVV